MNADAKQSIRPSASRRAPEFDRTLEAFFFGELFGVWRAPDSLADSSIKRVWVFCPPFAEEEKSARRTLVALCNFLSQRGDASLLFSLRGTGDSEGNFAGATAEQWLDDVRLACIEARRRAPAADLCLCGLRLGATLAQCVAAEMDAAHAVLIEPQNGKSVLQELRQKKRLRAMMTRNESGNSGETALPEDDFDGWPISAALRESLQNLDAPRGEVSTLFIAVNPRGEATAAQSEAAREMGAQTCGVKMPAFWNRLDTTDATPLLETVSQW